MRKHLLNPVTKKVYCNNRAWDLQIVKSKENVTCGACNRILKWRCRCGHRNIMGSSKCWNCRDAKP